jgi:serine/threonine-protein kinase
MSTLGPGVTVDRYRLVTPVGEGGQGTVWRAEDPLHPGTPVALKLVPLDCAPPSVLERFRREARSLARLSHPSLPRCHALFEDLQHDVVGLALDFIEGSPLAVLVASPHLTPEHRVWILRHLAAALAFIHEAGLVHRDVKPENVMIAARFTDHPEDPSGVKLVDFGIASEPSNPQPLTVTGSIIGTIAYLAPELLDRGFWKEPADGPERDVFALGVLAFELLRGRHPTGVPTDAPLGDFLVAYRAHADDAAWPRDLEGDALEPFYRGCLALRSARRAPDGAAAAALLADGQPASMTARAASEARARLESARTEQFNTSSLLVDSLAHPRSKRRSFALYAGLGVSAAALFGASFVVSYSGGGTLHAPPRPASMMGERDRPNLNAEEPPNPAVPASPARSEPGRPAAHLVSNAGHAVVGATAGAPVAAAVPVPFPATLRCPKEMVAVGGPPPFCIDQREVSVAEYRACTACGPAKEAFWLGPTFSEKARAEQTQNCTNTRTGLDNYPINCVSYQDAVAYCAGASKRLPRMDEWRKARGAITMCSEVGGVCPLFEWSADPTSLSGYRATRGPSFRYLTAMEGSNVEAARNDDLGFRCARDPMVR